MIPIGIVSNVFSGYIGGAGPIFYSNDFSVQQNVFDHILNRFPPGNGNFGYVYGGGFNPNTLNTFSVGAMNFRGVISTHAVGLNPIDLGTQIFYPGDCVTYVSGSNAGTIYQYINTYPYVFPETPGASNGWNQILNGVPGTAPNDLP
jgi:hypothetical protein